MSDQQLSRVGNIMISYSRRNLAFVRKLYDGFIDFGLTDENIWADWEDIPLSADWMVEITKGIREADAIIFIQTPDSLSSQVCGEEVVLAAENHKRFVVIDHIAPTPENTIHPALAAGTNIAIPDIASIPANMEAVMTAANQNLDYLKTHTRLQVRAVDWRENNENTDLLLRGDDISNGERWLASAAQNEPRPTGIQGEYLIVSREYQTITDRRRMLLFGFFAIVAMIAMIIAGFQFTDARAQEKDADEQRVIAETQSSYADYQAETAVAAGETAVVERNIASTKQVEAETGATQQAIALFEAETQESIALTAEANAHIESTAAAQAAQTAVAALATSVAEANARATQQAIAEAEAIARATQEAIAIAEANARATQEVIAQANSTQAAQAAATAMAEARLANALTLASTARNLQYTDPQLARLLVLLAVKETEGLLAEPSDTVKAALIEIASNPLLKDLDVSGGADKNITVELTAAGKLLTHFKDSSEIQVRNLTTGALESTYSIGFAAKEFGLDPTWTKMIAFNDTQVSYWPDVLSSSHVSVSTSPVAMGALDGVLDFSIYPVTNQLALLSATANNNQIVALYTLASGIPVFQDSVQYYDAAKMDIGTWEEIVLAPNSGGSLKIFVIGTDGTQGNRTWVFDLVGGTSIYGTPTSSDNVFSLATDFLVISPDYKQAIFSQSVLIINHNFPSGPYDVDSGHGGVVGGIAFSKSAIGYTDPTTMVSVGENGRALVFTYSSLTNPRLAYNKTLDYSHTALTDVIVYTDSTFFVAGTNEGEIMWYDLNETAPADYLAAITELEGELLSNTLDAANCAKYTPVNCTYADLGAPVVQRTPGQGISIIFLSLFLSVSVVGSVVFRVGFRQN